MNVTPLQKIDNFIDGVNLYIKRDDLLPISFGGNKVRIAEEYFADMTAKGKNCIIGYGNARSNLCRVLANIACIRNIPCYIISPQDDNGERKETANSFLVSQCGARVYVCEKSKVAETVATVMHECIQNGLSPYYINGDKFGRGNEIVPMRAYEKVYAEIEEQSKQLGISFDFIFHASGTGMTQSGLLLGKYKYGGTAKIVGFSVARDRDRAHYAIENFLKAYSIDNSDVFCKENINVCDEYLCGGYGYYDKSIRNCIMNFYRSSGIALDPTYTGKAFWGMQQYIQKNKIQGNALFIHTGGAPLFFDFLGDRTLEYENSTVTKCSDAKALLQFLVKIDYQLPTPLSDRVELSEFADKVINLGKAVVIKHNDEIISAGLFCCNDTKNKKAYLTLLATHHDFEGKGYEKKIMLAIESYLKDIGMLEFHLDTEKSNTHAVSFYSKLGYYIDYVGRKIHMAKKL